MPNMFDIKVKTSDEELAALVDPMWSENPVWRSIDCGPGWNDIIATAVKFLAVVAPQSRIVQIKEKFGELRFYFDYSDEDALMDSRDVSSVIAAIEMRSARTCEKCGNYGKPTRSDTGWWSVRCSDCLTPPNGANVEN